MKAKLQLLKFSLVGVLNTFLHYIVFLILLRWVGLSLVISSAIGYSVGIVNSYIINRTWTFQVSKRIEPVEFLLFVLVNAVAMSINLFILRTSVKNFNLSPEIGQIVAIFFSLFINFIGNKYITFKKKKIVNEKNGVEA